MKKLLLGILLAVFITSLASSRALASQCGEHGTHNYCGSQVGCPNGQLCVVGWGVNNWQCVEDARCKPETIDQSVYRCGYNFTGGWCGGLGGCAAGYKCNGSTYTCESDSSYCEHKNQLTTGVQCGVGYAATNNQCGEYGGCENGYRCIIGDNGVGSCKADLSSTLAANRCPGSPTQDPVVLSCGEETDNPNATCNCSGNTNSIRTYRKSSTATIMNCCGWVRNDSCAATAETAPPDNGGGGDTNPPNPQPDPDNGGTGGDGSNGNGSSGDTTPKIDIFDGPTSAEFNLLNPLKTFGNASVTAELSSPGGIISRILAFAFPLAGLILFLMLVIAGFQIVVGGANGTKAIEAGRQRATNALIGFTLLFVAYWLMQIIEVIFGITIF